MARLDNDCRTLLSVNIFDFRMESEMREVALTNEGDLIERLTRGGPMIIPVQ